MSAEHETTNWPGMIELAGRLKYAPARRIQILDALDRLSFLPFPDKVMTLGSKWLQFHWDLPGNRRICVVLSSTAMYVSVYTGLVGDDRKRAVYGGIGASIDPIIDALVCHLIHPDLQS